jgi:hypothetical protein
MNSQKIKNTDTSCLPLFPTNQPTKMGSIANANSSYINFSKWHKFDINGSLSEGANGLLTNGGLNNAPRLSHFKFYSIIAKWYVKKMFPANIALHEFLQNQSLWISDYGTMHAFFAHIILYFLLTVQYSTVQYSTVLNSFCFSDYF